MKAIKDKKVLRRDFLKTVGAAGAAAAITLNAPYVKAAGGKTLRLLNAETSVDSIRALKLIAGEYEHKTGIKVIIDSVPVNQVLAKLTTSIKGGKPYDFATLGFIGSVLLLAEQGHLLPMDDLIKKYDWGPNILFPIKNKVYWYPYDYNLCNLYYRKDLYAAKGLKVPTTWDQLVDNAAALSNDDMKGIALPIGNHTATNWMSLGNMWAEGVELLDDNWNVILDDATMKKKAADYLDFFSRLYQSMPPGMSQNDYGKEIGLFVSGQVAHAAYSGRLAENLEKRAPDLASSYGVMPYPDSTGKKKAVNHGYDGFVVLNTAMAEESMKFMSWFTEEKYITWLHSAPIHFHPARLDVYQDKRWLAHPWIEKHAEAIAVMQGYLSDPDMIITSVDTQGPEPDQRPAKIFGSFALPEMLQNKLLKGLDSNECVELAAAKMRKAIG